MRRTLLATTATIGLIWGGGAHADFLFSPTNSPSSDEQTIQFEQQFSNQTSFQGDTNQTQTPITFDIPVLTGAAVGLQTKPEETGIGTNGQGQADITCTNGCNTFGAGGANGAQLTALEIKIGAGFGATDFVGNLDFGEGSARIAIQDQMGQIFDYTLGNGQNFFTINAINGEVITDIIISENAVDPGPGNTTGQFGWNDFKQPRVSGVCTLQGATCTAIPTPEPSSLWVLGGGLIGLWFAFAARRHFGRTGVTA